MLCSINKCRYKIKFENVRYTRIIFSKKTSEGTLPKNGSGEDSERRFMPVDVKVKESDVTLLFLFLCERNRCGLII